MDLSIGGYQAFFLETKHSAQLESAQIVLFLVNKIHFLYYRYMFSCTSSNMLLLFTMEGVPNTHFPLQEAEQSFQL